MVLRQKIKGVHCIIIFLNNFLNTLLFISCSLTFEITRFYRYIFARSSVLVLLRLYRKLFLVNSLWEYWITQRALLEGAVRHQCSRRCQLCTGFLSPQQTQSHFTNLPDVLLSVFYFYLLGSIMCFLSSYLVAMASERFLSRR